MSTTHIQPLPNVYGRMAYTELGEGKKRTENIQNGTNRIAAQMGDGDSREEFVRFCSAMKRQNQGRENEGFEVRVSWAPEELSKDNPEDIQRACEYGYLLCKEVAPNAPCWVTVHTDGEGGCVHVHATIANHDLETGNAIAHGTDHATVKRYEQLMEAERHPEEQLEKLQAEVDAARREFHASKEARDMLSHPCPNLLAGAWVFAKAGRDAKDPVSRMMADMTAMMLRMLLQQAMEEQRRREREAAERRLYESRRNMWDAEKRLKSAEKVLAHEDEREEQAKRIRLQEREDKAARRAGGRVKYGADADKQYE